MVTINHGDATEVKTHVFYMEASSLQLPPGTWPQLIETSLGNGRPFVLSDVIIEDDELIAKVYRQELGCISLHLLND